MAWAARWIAGPLDANSIPTGDALDNSGKSYSNGQLHRAVEKYYDKILTWLGNASVRVPVEIDSKGNPKLVESYHRETDPYLNRVSSAFQYVRDLRHLLTIDGSGNAFPQRRIVFSPQIIRPAQTFFDTNRYFLEEFLQNVPVPVDSPR